ncbi:hypothetical protein E4U30_006202 [Claviceps sp. LM220 group G6]|nr:hypothetical protein E4U30_006202 [Claviceps sp. LM220 group G6]
MRQRANESFTEFLVRFESQMAKADRLDMPDIDKIDLFAAIGTRIMDIPSDNYAAAAAARDRALDLRAALRRMPVSSTTAGPSMDTEGDTVMTRVASTGFAGKGKGKAKIQGPVPGRRGVGGDGRRIVVGGDIRISIATLIIEPRLKSDLQTASHGKAASRDP